MAQMCRKCLHTHSFDLELNEYNATCDAVSNISEIYGSLCCKAAKFILPSAMFEWNAA